MDLSTTYMGMTLRTPLVLSASPLTEDVDNIKRIEEAGASAIVLHSLFEEEIRNEARELAHHLSFATESHAEALTYFPEPAQVRSKTEEYLDLIQLAKHTVDIPIIASLNATSPGSWTEFATLVEGAGADAIELNIYHIETDFERASTAVEESYLQILHAVKAAVDLPIAVKLSPFFTNLAAAAKHFDDAGAAALVLFNRFYQPDIDLEHLEVIPRVLLSTPMAARLPMRWLAILYGHVQGDLAATSGIHKATDMIKMLMVGASITMLCSALLRNGIDYLKTLEADLVQWMEENEYESVTQMRGSMSQRHCADPSSFERAHYMKMLQSYPH